MSMGGMSGGCPQCPTLDEAFGAGGPVNNVWGGSNQVATSLANTILSGSASQPDFLSAPAINNNVAVASNLSMQSGGGYNPGAMSGAYNAGAAQAAMSNMVKSMNPQMVANAVQAPSVNAAAQAKKVETFVNSNGQVVTVSTPAVPAANTAATVTASGSSSGSWSQKDMRVCLVNLGFLILAALSVNEAAKYYINKSLQTAEGNVPYYLVYAVLAVLVMVGVHVITKQHM